MGSASIKGKGQRVKRAFFKKVERVEFLFRRGEWWEGEYRVRYLRG